MPDISNDHLHEKNFSSIGAFYIYLFITFGQDLGKILIDKLYLTTFDKVLDDISIEHHVRFLYDREALSLLQV